MPSLAIGKRLQKSWAVAKITASQSLKVNRNVLHAKNVYSRLLSSEISSFKVMTPCRAIRSNNFVFCLSAGLMNVDQYISLLARLIEDNEPALVATRADR